jgi:hypothetical protein
VATPPPSVLARSTSKLDFGSAPRPPNLRFSSLSYVSQAKAQLALDAGLAGEEGFEPPNTRTKTWRLTTWPLPNLAIHTTLFFQYAAF